MINPRIKRKFVFIGDTNSINIEIVIKSFSYLKNKINYIVICNKKDFLNDQNFKKSKFKINEIVDPIGFYGFNKNKLNIFNIQNISNNKYLNMLNQIKIANELANLTKYDLITMPINKALFKKNIKFNGMTEHFGKLNHCKTLMLMVGDKFSIIPITTHISPKNIHRAINKRNFITFLKFFLSCTKNKFYNLSYNQISFLCYNPHCGEEGLLGNEDKNIKELIKNYKKINGPFPADSAFKRLKKNTLFISTYHDQALVPFKIINKRSLNLTLGLNFRRLSPTHGIARDIKNKNLADNSSYLTCLLF